MRLMYTCWIMSDFLSYDYFIVDCALQWKNLNKACMETKDECQLFQYGKFCNLNKVYSKSLIKIYASEKMYRFTFYWKRLQDSYKKE